MSDCQNHRAYLDAMGIAVWVRRVMPTDSVALSSSMESSPPVPLCSTSQEESSAILPMAVVSDAVVPETKLSGNAVEKWEMLRQAVTACTACKLHQTRTQTVFGVGNRQADWLLVGEAPGADEDAQGEPFVGRAGKLLNEMLFAANMPREQVFIANILKCRPPNNRDPLFDEMVHCTPFLRQQIALLQPKLIIALGKTAAQYLLDTQTPISRLRGQEFTYADTGIPLIPTYHPAYLLRSPQQKRTAWLDIQFICRTYARIRSHLP